MEENELNLLKKFFDSNWFRETFSDNFISLMAEEGNNYIGRDEKGRLWVSDAPAAIISVAQNIFSISYAFYHHYKKTLFPTSKNMKNINTFEEFAQEHFEKHIKNRIDERKIKEIVSELESYPSEFIKCLTKRSLTPPYYAFRLPPKFWEIFGLVFRHSSYMYEVRAAIERVLH
jgi:hypothetical protein